MFNFFKPKPYVPLDAERRHFFEHNLLWLKRTFPKPTLHKRKVFMPVASDFPIDWKKGEETAHDLLPIVCKAMDIHPLEIQLEFFNNGRKMVDMGSYFEVVNTEPNTNEAAGEYFGKNKNGKYLVGLEEGLLQFPDNLIATLVHELAHVKLMGHAKMDYNDEMLTDLTTVFFGFGIFNANTAFQFNRSNEGWSWSDLGYLKIDEWAYALALFTYLRKENNPEWEQYLNPTIKKLFKKSSEYIYQNEGSLFKTDDQQK